MKGLPMMANIKSPPEPRPQERDPFAIHSVEALFTLFENGEFLKRFMKEHRDLLTAMQDHSEDFGHKGAKGGFTITVGYAMAGSGDLGMTAQAQFKLPKTPASGATAFVDGQGNLTLYSPMMKRMHGGVRDITDHDPDTGEVRDTD